MGGERAVQVDVGAVDDVLGRDVAVVGPQQLPDDVVRWTSGALATARQLGGPVEEFGLFLVERGGHVSTLVRHDGHMKFRHELSYDATPAEVFEMLADPTFRERVSAALEVVSAEVSVERTDSGFTLTNDQVQRTEGLPSFAKRIAGDTTHVIQTEVWGSPTGGTLTIDAPGKPTSMAGTIALVAEGAGTTEVVELEIKAKVPLVGGKLEGLMARQVRDGMDAEREVGAAWLKGDR